jgi:hypothetical protein
MIYNIFIGLQNYSYNLTQIGKEEVDLVCAAYLNGDDFFYLAGTQHSLKNIRQISVFESNEDYMHVDLFPETNYQGMVICKRNITGDWYYTPDGLKLFGSNKTVEFIGHKPFGANKDQLVAISLNSDLYISSDRISALENINSDEFDLTRLIKICQELNDNYAKGNYLSTGILLRSLLDHIPPIFKHESFIQFSSQYSFAGTSFKKNMKHLQDSFRNIADSMLHSPIKRKEVLPTLQQIDFRADIDILLAEIIKTLN